MSDGSGVWVFDLSGEHGHWRNLPPHICEAWAFARESEAIANRIHCTYIGVRYRYLSTMLGHYFYALKAGRPMPPCLVDLGAELHFATPHTVAIDWIRCDNWHFLGCELFEWTRRIIAMVAGGPSGVDEDVFWRDCTLEGVREKSGAIGES